MIDPLVRVLIVEVTARNTVAKKLVEVAFVLVRLVITEEVNVGVSVRV